MNMYVALLYEERRSAYTDLNFADDTNRYTVFYTYRTRVNIFFVRCVEYKQINHNSQTDSNNICERYGRFPPVTLEDLRVPAERPLHPAGSAFAVK